MRHSPLSIIRELGHAPSVATLNGFQGLTNVQAFEAFAMSDTVTHALSGDIAQFITATFDLVAGVPGEVVGQAAQVHHLIG